MPSWDHEGIVELFRKDPRLAAELLAGPLGVDVPAFSDAGAEPKTMRQVQPAQLHADLVVTLRDGSRPVLGIVLEVQLSEDVDKPFTWPAYVTWLRRELRADCCVLVVTQSESVANWASRTIVVGPGCTLKPLVLRPRSVPVVDKVEKARRSPELAVLSTMAHGGGDVQTAVDVAVAASTAARELDRDSFLLYFGLILRALSEAARKAFQMHSQGAQLFDEALQKSFETGRSVGRAAEKAADVLDFLDARGIAVTSEQRERILGCTDLQLLGTWVRRAATVTNADELFID
jgi:hypothetical protein